MIYEKTADPPLECLGQGHARIHHPNLSLSCFQMKPLLNLPELPSWLGAAVGEPGAPARRPARGECLSDTASPTWRPLCAPQVLVTCPILGFSTLFPAPTAIAWEGELPAMPLGTGSPEPEAF